MWVSSPSFGSWRISLICPGSSCGTASWSSSCVSLGLSSSSSPLWRSGGAKSSSLSPKMCSRMPQVPSKSMTKKRPWTVTPDERLPAFPVIPSFPPLLIGPLLSDCYLALPHPSPHHPPLFIPLDITPTHPSIGLCLFFNTSSLRDERSTPIFPMYLYIGAFPFPFPHPLSIDYHHSGDS